MWDALMVVTALLIFLGGLIAVLWPLRAIVQSAKVRGFRKLAWVGLYFFGYALGGFLDWLLWIGGLAMLRSDSQFAFQLIVLSMFVVGLVPVWGVFILFRLQTRNSPDLESRANSFGFSLGQQVRRLLALWK